MDAQWLYTNWINVNVGEEKNERGSEWTTNEFHWQINYSECAVAAAAIIKDPEPAVLHFESVCISCWMNSWAMQISIKWNYCVCGLDVSKSFRTLGWEINEICREENWNISTAWRFSFESFLFHFRLLEKFLKNLLTLRI